MDDGQLYKSFGAGVARRRKLLGMTQEKVAALADLTRATLANIETGRQQVLLHQVYRLAAALGLDDVSTLLVDRAAPSSDVPARPMDAAKVTPAQRGQIDRAIFQALNQGGAVERSST